MRVLGVFGQERACWAVVGSSTEQVTVKIFDCLIAESRPGGLAESAPLQSTLQRIE